MPFISSLALPYSVLNSCKEKDPDPVAPAAPTNLAFDDVKDVTAVLTWAGEATTYEVAVGDAAAVPVTGKKYTATSLTPETAYAWKVRAKDGELYSEWVDGDPFTTEEVELVDIDDVDFAYRLAHRAVVFSGGKIIADDEIDNVFASDDIVKAARLKRPLLFEVGKILKARFPGLENGGMPRNIAQLQEYVCQLSRI